MLPKPIGLAAVLICTGLTAQAADDLVPFDLATFDPAAYDIEAGKDLWERRGNCIECHGWDGDNRGRNPRAPGPTPNLRETSMDAGMLFEVIACGRPYTAMPHHLQNVYDSDICYGLTAEDIDPGEVPEQGNTLRRDAITELVAYIMTDIIDAGDTTREQCEAFYRPGHRNCRGFD